MFQTDLYQSSLSVYKVNNVTPSKEQFQTLQRKYHSFGLFDQFQDSTKFESINITSANFCPEMATIRISLLHSKCPISYNKKCISHFCYLSVKS